jgi:type I restriction enzyme M protein
MLTSETKRRIDACRDVLVGKLPLPTDQVELITLALIYKFMDDLDEQSVKLGGKRSFFTGDLAKYRWRNLLTQTISGDDRVTLFSEGIEALGNPQKAAHLPGLFRDIFRNAFLKFRDGRILTMFLTEVNGFEYSHSEELGNAFEYLLQCMGIQGENGQFRTPRHIIDFMIACLDPQPGDKILDPACGTGGFLVSAYKHILEKHTSPGSTMPGDRLTHGERQKVYANLAGYDVTDLMVKLSKVNLFLHGFPDPAIHIYDTLSNDARWNEKADLILANPPFMTPKGGVTPHTKFRIAAKKAEVLFTDYIAEHLTSDGRGGVIVPNGIVATTQNAYVKLRRFLVEDSLVAVVSLPPGVFKPYSGVKTSILFLDKKLARQTKETLFLKISADGFDLGDKRNPIEANDLPEAERVVKAWLKGKLGGEVETPLVWKRVDKQELLADKNHSLSAERFLGGEGSPFETVRVPLGHIATFEYGHTATAGETGDARYIRITDIDKYGCLRPNDAKFIPLDEEAKASLARKGDVFVARIGATAGKTLLFNSTEPAVFASYLIRVRLDPERLLPEFYWCLSQSKQYWEQREQLVSGGGQPQLNANALKLIEIPLPPLEEQRRIVAEIEGCHKVLNGARQILAGYIPSFDVEANWPTVQLAELCESITDGDHQPPPKSRQGVPFVTISNINEEHRLDFANTFFVPQSYYDKLNTSRKPKRGDILYTVTGSYGIPVLVDFDEPFCFQRHIGLVRPSDKIEGKFLYWTLASSFVMDQAHRTAVGAAQKTVSLNSLRAFSIPVPSLEEQRRIVAALDAEAAQMEAVRSLLPHFEAKIQRVLDRVWGSSEPE